MATTLLVVDSIATLRDTLSWQLARLGHFAATDDGRGITTLLNTIRFDLLLLPAEDENLDWREVLAAPSQRPAVILLSTEPSVELAIAALRLGVCDLLRKPPTLAELSRAIEKALVRHSAATREAAGWSH